VRVSFTWLGVRKALSAEQKAQAAEGFGAEGAYLSAAKKLLDTRDPSFRAVTGVRSRTLGFWRGVSLPFPEPGVRLVRRDAVAAFDAQLDEFREELAVAVDALDERLEDLKSAARARLGQLYSPTDYPASLRGLFAVATNHIYDGRDLHGMRLELSGDKDGRSWETSARYGFGADDGAGDGPGIRIRPDGEVLRRSDIDSEGTEGNYTLTGAYAQPLAGGKVRLNARHYGAKFKFEQDEVISFPAPGLITIDDNVRLFDPSISAQAAVASKPRRRNRGSQSRRSAFSTADR
jgi:hypothetical protein